MKKKDLIIILLLFEVAILFYGNSFLGLFESSEARYAEVAREMLETKDFISPQMDYVYHFTKPPLTYYLTALGMKIFGVNTFGVRFFVTIFALLTLLISSKISEEFGQNNILTVFFLGSFPLFFVMAKVLTTDMFLTFFVTLGVYLFILYQNGKVNKRLFSVLFGVTLGMSILTKGQVGIIYFIMIFGGMALFRKDFSKLKVFLSPVLWALALLSSGWWFLIVGLKHEGLLNYLFFKEAVEASYSSKRFHPGPFYYYIPVLLGGLFPYWVLFPSIKRFKSNVLLKFLVSYTIFPFILFSIFPAKLPTYLLPSTPGWAFLFCEKEDARKKLLKIVSLLLTLFLFFLSFVVYFAGEKYIGRKTDYAAIIFLIGAFFSLSAFFFSFKKGEEIVFAAIFVALLFSYLSIPTLINQNQEKFKIAKETAFSIKENISEEDEVLELRTTIFSIPFYLQKKVYAFENNFFRKKFLKDKPEHILQGEEELNKFIENTPYLWVVVDKKSEQFFKEKYPTFSLFKKGQRYIIYTSSKIKERLNY